MSANSKCFPIIKILLMNSFIRVIRPFSQDTISKTTMDITLSCGYNDKSINPRLPIKATIDLRILEKEDKQEQEHVHINVEYLIMLKTDEHEINKSIIDNIVTPYVFSSVWPYFSHDIDCFLVKSGYHHFYLPPFGHGIQKQ